MNDTPDNKNLPAGSAKRSSPLLKVLPLAVLAAVLVYFAAQIHSYFSDPMTVTVTYESQAEDTVSMEGWLVRTEEPLPAQSGTVSRQVQEGQRVAAGQTVATVYSDDSALQTVSQIETLELQLQQLLCRIIMNCLRTIRLRRLVSEPENVIMPRQGFFGRCGFDRWRQVIGRRTNHRRW